MKQIPAGTLRMLSRLACLAFSLIALGLIFSRVDLPTLGRTLSQAKLGWMAAAAAAFALGLLAAAARWHIVLRLSQLHVHGSATFSAVLIGHLFNTALFGPTGGDIAKTALYARRYRFPAASVFASCVLDRFLGGVGFLIFASCTPGFAVYGGHWWERLTRFASSGRFPFVVGGVVIALLIAWLLKNRWGGQAPTAKLGRAFLVNGRQLLRHPELALRGLVFAVLSHLALSCVFLFSLKAVTEITFSLSALFWIFPVITLITSAPITFSGVGLREGAALFFLGLYKIPAADAVAASLLVLLTYVAWAAMAGVVFWRSEDKQGSAPIEPLPKTISAVVPTLNEADALPETIARARQVPEITEILVVDGGSSDGTAQVAAELGCRVLAASPGRGGQLRLGASSAQGDAIMFLHADTWLPPNAGVALLNCLRDRTVAGGGFWKVFREKNALMLGSRFRCALRLLLFKRLMGDQVMFARRTALERIGGVPDVPLMEEFELCKRLREVGELALAGATVSTSARRFAKLGVVRTYLRMWHVTARYYLGTPAQELKELYERE
jgi:rSAM/selenodomain-associated transferase 2